MKRTGQLFRSLVVGYLVLGVLIHFTQGFGGRACYPLPGERREGVGREALIMTVILWPSDLASHLRSKGARVSEYLLPTGCFRK